VLVAVEGVYSMDGDIAPLPEIIALKKMYGCLLLVDEAHSLGVLGATGRGVGEHFGVDRRDVDMWMGTMSKTLASCGGYIAGSAALVEYLKYTTPGFIYSVGMTPANAAAALTALRILTDEPERARICQGRSRLFLELCKARGVDTGDSRDSAVIPCIVGNSYASIRLAEALLARGIHVHPIVYPAVADNLSRLRFFVTAAHSEAQLRATADALAEEMAKLGLLAARRGEGPGQPGAADTSGLS
jgi:7-keto-8-aminopelargonate synthetase-like enzyme